MTLAVYTTIYPGATPYLADWCRSLRLQTDQEFQLWIGLDQVGIDSVQSMLGTDLKAHWVIAPSGATPAQIREQALQRIAESSCGVVLVDSDDLLHPSRVAAARKALKDCDLAGCGLRVVDQQGNDLGWNLSLPMHLEPQDVIPRNNVFGFSNSAFRSDLLKRCLPIPADAVLVDWFLATKAWLLGARLSFDRVPRMDYRQYSANTARVRYPFSAEQVVSDTALVRQHFQLSLTEPVRNFAADRYAELKSVVADVEEFYRQIVLDPARLARYVEAFNSLAPQTFWWTCVAYPALEHMWK